MPQRFYHPELSDSGTVTLGGTEAHHLIHVLRGRTGEIVELFDGAGLVASAEIAVVEKRDVELRILQSHRDALPSRQVILGTAVPKGDRFDWLVEKATELGVTKLIPLVTARSIVDPRESKLDKLRQTVIAACKQSGRNRLLELSPVMKWSDFCEHDVPGRTCFVAHPRSNELSGGAVAAKGGIHPVDGAIVFAVGPEGGFTDEEIALAVARGARLIDFGSCILRIETAALALAASVAVQALDQ